MRQVLARVISNSNILPNIYLMWLEAPEIASMAQPGQFVMVRCGEGYDLLLRRPFSIHQVKEECLALFFRVVGRGTEWLSQCREGDKLDLFGPLGKGFSIASSSQNLLLVAGGMGIAPLTFLAQKALKEGKKVTLLLGAKTASLIYPEPLLSYKLPTIIATEDGSVGRKGMLTDILPDFLSSVDQIFACGPVSMYQSMAGQGALRGKSVQVSLEVRMGCGVGACSACTVKTRQGLRQVCKDGPVFELEEVLWDKLEI